MFSKECKGKSLLKISKLVLNSLTVFSFVLIQNAIHNNRNRGQGIHDYIYFLLKTFVGDCLPISKVFQVKNINSL